MYFFPEPQDAFKIVGRNYASHILGGKSGNETAYRALQRALLKNTPVVKMKNSEGGRAALKAFAELVKRLNIKEADLEWYRTATLEDVETRWSLFLFMWKLKKTIPQTVHFANRLAKNSIMCRHLWDSGDRAAAIQMVSHLPWAHMNTMQWYLSVLRTNERDLPEEWHLPAQVMSLFAITQMAVLEGLELGSPADRSWNVYELMAARHPDTGQLAAICYFLERTKAATSIETNVEFDRAAFGCIQNPETWHREIKAYRAGKSIPSHQTCLNINSNMIVHMSKRSAEELYYLASAACFCQKAFDRLQKTRDLTLEPISLFDDFQEFRGMSKEALWETSSTKNSLDPAMTP
ncbi:hypothetical protein RA28_19700 [Ruegeria sp. ANG-S4]|nr:hypothetical protein RA28_19700 [Ruegeria sp. ANG-S4]